MSLEFTKMQGLGNDFIVVEGPMDLTADDVAALCDRRFGIGADGVLVLEPGDDVAMEYRNADGSAAEMCGNGLRCAARYAYDRGWVGTPEFVVETAVGPRRVRVGDGMVEAELGPIRVTGEAAHDGHRLTLVEVGNPHAVVFVDDPLQVDVSRLGSSIESGFPGGLNVEFVHVAPDGLAMRVWERGVGETMACGTGMAAAVAAARQEDGRAVRVTVPGGTGSVTIRDGVAWITGPAEYSFRGSVAGR